MHHLGGTGHGREGGVWGQLHAVLGVAVGRGHGRADGGAASGVALLLEVVVVAALHHRPFSFLHARAHQLQAVQHHLVLRRENIKMILVSTKKANLIQAYLVFNCH